MSPAAITLSVLTVFMPTTKIDNVSASESRKNRTRRDRFGIPTTFLIDRQWVVREVFTGYRPREVFEGAIKKLLAEPQTGVRGQ